MDRSLYTIAILTTVGAPSAIANLEKLKNLIIERILLNPHQSRYPSGNWKSDNWRFDMLHLIAMIIQTNPAVFSPSLPVYTVTSIQGDVVSLHGSDGSLIEIPLSNWGPYKDGHPVVGSKIQLLEERK
jgi:hypothetical protein